MKNTFTILLIFISQLIYSQTKSVIWPVSGSLPGANIIYQPQDYIEEELNFGNLFIGGNTDDYVIAPCDGTISNISYSYSYTLSSMSVVSCDFPTDANVTEYDLQYRQAIAKELGDKLSDSKFISFSISIHTNNKEEYWISGIRPYQSFKTGYPVKQGDTIGTIGYAYHKIHQPCICVSKSKYDKPIDPMASFGLSSSFIPPKASNINYLSHKHSKEQLLEDFTIFRESLEEAHPGLYDYISKADLNKAFEKLQKSIEHPLTSEQFRKELTQILLKIRDSHTFLYPRKYRISNKQLLPIRFGLQDSSLVVYQSIPEYKNYLGKKIVAINGQEVKSVTKEIKNNFYGSDGFIQSQINRKLLDQYDREYIRLYSLLAGDKVDIEFNDTSHIFTCSKLKHDSYLPKWNNPSPCNQRCEVKKLNARTALLDINTFELLRSDLDGIDKFIAQINQDSTENLIIDLRDNLGGSPECLNHIYSLIAKNSFNSCIASKVTQNNTYKMFADCYNFSPTQQDIYPNYKSIEGKEGYYLPDSCFKAIPPNKNIHFSGNVTVLINEYSCSASTVFAALVQKFKRGEIIGRETGSSYHQLNATNFARVNLKNSGLELRIPLVKSIFENKDESKAPWGRGVIPDHEIKLSYSEFTDDADATLTYALESIKRKSQSKPDMGNSLYFVLLLTLLTTTLVVYSRKKRRKQANN